MTYEELANNWLDCLTLEVCTDEYKKSVGTVCFCDFCETVEGILFQVIGIDKGYDHGKPNHHGIVCYKCIPRLLRKQKALKSGEKETSLTDFSETKKK